MVPIQAIVFDLGDVLMSWWPPADGKVDVKKLKRAMNSQTWHEFDRGRVSEDMCFEQIGKDIGISAIDIRETIEKSKLSLRPNREMMEVLHYLRDQQAHVKLYLASNISKPHWEFVRQKSKIEWGLFEEVFISADIGMRKPDVCFYAHVLDRIGHKKSPASVMFFDDKLENVVTAQTLGMTAVQFEDIQTMKCQMMNRLADPIFGGMTYLEANAGRMWSVVDNMEIKENFAQLLIFEASDGRQDLVTLKPAPLLWNYFQEKPNVSTVHFPDDFDTTSIALSVLERQSYDDKRIGEVLDLILQYRNCDGLPAVYADHSRPRFDPIVCVHIFTLFHLYGRSWQLEQTWSHITQILQNRAYKNGTYYYTAPDYFLLSVSRLIQYSHERSIPLPGSRDDIETFLELFRSRCLERVNSLPEDPLSLAIRIIACRRSGIPTETLQLDAEKLQLLQEGDGGWPLCEIYKIPSAKAGIGNRGVVTAFAIKALRLMNTDSNVIVAIPESSGSYLQNLLAVSRRIAAELNSGLIPSSAIMANTIRLAIDIVSTLLGLKVGRDSNAYGRNDGVHPVSGEVFLKQ